MYKTIDTKTSDIVCLSKQASKQANKRTEYYAKMEVEQYLCSNLYGKRGERYLISLPLGGVL